MNKEPAADTPLQKQRKALKGYVTRGVENPAKEFSKREFRQRLSKAIIRDDESFTFCEGAGMQDLFEYILPPNVRLPSHQTVRRDLDKLYEAISLKVTATMKVLTSLFLSNIIFEIFFKNNASRIAVASDSWTSKSSVYAFLAPVGFWISDDWKLEELVLDFIPLNGDHSGKHSGKVLFQSLRARGVTKKICRNDGFLHLTLTNLCLIST